MTQTTDLKAIADALRRHDRFLVVTHENPDGDALGSLLAMTIALQRLGKDPVMYLPGKNPLPAEYGFMPLEGVVREPPADAAERVLLAVDCAKEDRIGDDAAISRAPLVIDIDHHHDNTRFGDLNLIVADASSTGEVLRDVFAELGVELTPELAEPLYIALVTDTGRFQYTNTTPKALRLAAELVEAGGHPRRLPGGLRVRRVRETEAARARARPGRGARGRTDRRLAPPAHRLCRRRRRRAVLRGDHRLSARRRGGRASGADPRAAERERARPQGIAPLEHRRARRLRDRPPFRGWWPPSGRRLLHRSAAAGNRGADPRRLSRPTCRLARLSPPEWRSSTSLRGRRRSRSSRRSAA